MGEPVQGMLLLSDSKGPFRGALAVEKNLAAKEKGAGGGATEHTFTGVTKIYYQERKDSSEQKGVRGQVGTRQIIRRSSGFKRAVNLTPCRIVFQKEGTLEVRMGGKRK